MSVPSVFVPKDILPKLSNREWFKQYLVGYCYSSTLHFGVKIRMSAASVLEAYSQWSGDIARISQFELGGGTPDHFKQAGHLAYWLRRCKPIYEFNIDESFPIAGDAEDERRNKQGQKILLKCGNEYLSFALGYHICVLHCVRDEEDLSKVRLNDDYLETICQFLRNKNVSPHALFLIYRSLFHQFKSH